LFPSSHGITTPIDVVKTKMQTDPSAYTKGVAQAARDIVAAEVSSKILLKLTKFHF